MVTISVRNACVLVFAVTMLSNAIGQAGVSAPLQRREERKLAPRISLHDAAGKIVDLDQYRGKVVLLDFWATWCHGCGEEIPWFSAFHQKCAVKGLAVVGISMDMDGWKVVRPFIKSAHIPYTILLGDNDTGKQYGIDTLPDTFLVDREGRIAAAYHGLVDRRDMETNIETMLAAR